MKKELLLFFTSNIFAKFITGITGIVLARFLTKYDFGLLKTSLAWVGLISIFANSGILDYYLYKLSKNKSIEKAGMFFKQIGIHYIIILPFIFMFIFVGNFKLFILNIILYFKAFFDSLNDIFYKTFQGLNRFKELSFFILITSFPVFFSTILTVILNKSVFFYALSFFTFTFLLSLFFIFYFKKKFGINLQNINLKTKILPYYAFPFFVSNLMAYIYMQADVLMLSVIKGNVEVARYSVVITIIMALYLFPTILYNYFLPKLTENWKKKNNYLKILKKYFVLNLSISFLIFVIFFSWSKEIILLLYTEKYIDSLNIFKILIIVFFFHSIVFTFGAVLTSAGKQKIRANAQIFAALLNIFLNLVFIPEYGAEGAALTTAFTEVIIFILYLYFTKQLLSH